jgi:hypothetical protein
LINLLLAILIMLSNINIVVPADIVEQHEQSKNSLFRQYLKFKGS